MTAQWPRPGNVPVPHPDGGSIAPFSDPINRFGGCFLDSTGAREFQFPFRTLRARVVRIAPELDAVLMIVGSELFLYRGIDRFFAHGMAAPLNLRSTTAGEQWYLDPDASFYAERSGWREQLGTFDSPSAPTLYDVAYDDRGYIYLAHGPYGLIVLQYTGASSFREVFRQANDDVHPSPVKVEVSGNILLVFSAGTSTAMWDVRSPTEGLVRLQGAGPGDVPNPLTVNGITYQQPPIIRSGFGWTVVAGQEGMPLACQNLRFYDRTQKEVPSVPNGDFFAHALLTSQPDRATGEMRNRFGFQGPPFSGINDVALWQSGDEVLMVCMLGSLGWVFALRGVGAAEIPVVKPPVVIDPPKPPIVLLPDPPPPPPEVPNGFNTAIVVNNGLPVLAGQLVPFSAQRFPNGTWPGPYTWNFGDSRNSVASVPAPLHTYDAAGRYLLVVTIAGVRFDVMVEVGGGTVQPRDIPTNHRYFFDDAGQPYSWDHLPPRPPEEAMRDDVDAAADHYRHFAFDHVEYLTITGVDVAAHRTYFAPLFERKAKALAQMTSVIDAAVEHYHLLQHIGNWVVAGRPTS